MRPILIAGNWKMNGSLEGTAELIEGIKAGSTGNTGLAVFPPAVFLMKVGDMLSGTDIALGAQNVCDADVGAYTGEVSASMLKECGCEYAIVGHSERRSLYQESDQLVANRFLMAIRSEISPILCLGESLEQREAGITEEIVARQLDAVIERPGVSVLANSVIAYEPVWAIGTGRVATPDQAQSVHRFIREKIAQLDETVAHNIQILYGGSMNASNAGELLSQPDIDGGLIGGASLKAADFLAISQSV